MCEINRTCRWHECRAAFTITDAKYRAKLYCSPQCKQKMKQWKIARGAVLIEIAMSWHETRHTGKMRHPETGKRMTAQDVEAEFGIKHPALHNGAFPDLSALTGFIAGLRAERDGD